MPTSSLVRFSLSPVPDSRLSSGFLLWCLSGLCPGLAFTVFPRHLTAFFSFFPSCRCGLVSKFFALALHLSIWGDFRWPSRSFRSGCLVYPAAAFCRRAFRPCSLFSGLWLTGPVGVFGSAGTSVALLGFSLPVCRHCAAWFSAVFLFYGCAWRVVCVACSLLVCVLLAAVLCTLVLRCRLPRFPLFLSWEVGLALLSSRSGFDGLCLFRFVFSRLGSLVFWDSLRGCHGGCARVSWWWRFLLLVRSSVSWASCAASVAFCLGLCVHSLWPSGFCALALACLVWVNLSCGMCWCNGSPDVAGPLAEFILVRCGVSVVASFWVLGFGFLGLCPCILYPRRGAAGASFLLGCAVALFFALPAARAAPLCGACLCAG